MAGRGNRRSSQSRGQEGAEGSPGPDPLTVPDQARLERLQKRLQKQEQRLDHLVDTEEAGTMRGQQAKAGQRCVVLQLRAEIEELQLGRFTRGSETHTLQREAVNALLRQIKDAELAERNASKQRTDDDLRVMMNNVKHRAEGVADFHSLS